MTGRLRTSSAGLQLIKSFEGFRSSATPAPGGRWSIGYGHMRTAREGLRISEKDAEELLIHDLQPVEEAITGAVFAPLTQNQFDALASLVFNISPAQFHASDILSLLNAGDVLGAAAGFDAWRRARLNGRIIVVDALVRRRAAEKALFLDHPGGRVAAPTPVLRPEIDRDASAGGPRPPGAAVDAPAPIAGHDTHSVDIAEAVRRLAERTREAIAPAPEIPLPPGVMAAPPAAAQSKADTQPTKATTDPLQPLAGGAERDPAEAPAVTAGQMAERVRGILRGKGPAILPKPQVQTEANAPGEPGEPRPGRLSFKADPDNGPVREGLPDFDASPEPPLSARSAGRRALIDDTETFDPGRRPEELFAEAERQALIVNARTRRLGPLNGLTLMNAPWIILLFLSVLGCVGVIAALSGGLPAMALTPQLAGAGLAVFGLMLVMSLYFIVFSGDQRDQV